MTNSGTPKISIIIPIYNVEQYLKQTLFSAVNQTLRDIEILCVDDCSTDKSREIIEYFAQNDPRIRCVFLEENKGAGSARKEGIRLAAGEYIMFLDGDDYLDLTACQKLYGEISQSRADILHFGTNVVPTGTVTDRELEEVERVFKPCEEMLVDASGGHLTNCCFSQGKFGFNLWNKIYCTDVVKTAVNYYEDEHFNIAEDLYLFFLISFFAASYKGLPEAYYFYNFGAGITGGKRLLTDSRFRDKVRQGVILRHLQAFAREMDPLGKLDGSLKSLQDRFVSDAVWNWVWEGNSLDRAGAMDQVFACFDKGAVLSKLAEYYYATDITKKNTIVSGCKDAEAFSVKKTDIKTIGTYYFRLNNGGIERVIAKLMGIWSRMGYEVVLFTDELPGLTDYEIPDSVKRVVLPKITGNSSEQFSLRMEVLQQRLTQYSVDVMVCHAWFWEYMPLDMWATKSLGIPFVVHTHSFLGQGLKSGQAADASHSLFINTLYEMCDGVIALTKMDYNWLCSRKLTAFRTVNPLPFELDTIRKAPLNEKNILWVGRISWEKQPMDALKILREILDNGEKAKLQILGKADYEQLEQQLQNSIKELGLEEHVELLGFHTDVTPFYQNAGVYLCTSEYEGFLMTLAESKAFGVPAVLYELPNLDMVQEGKGMKVVGQNCTHDAAMEIIALLRDDQERCRLGREARESIEQMYAFDIPALWQQVFDTVSGKKAYVSESAEPEYLQRAIDMMLSFTARGIALREEERRFWKSQYDYAKRDYELAISQHPTAVPEDWSAGYSPAVVIDAREKVKVMFRNGDIAFRYIVRYVFAWLGFKWDRIRGKKKQ